MSETSSYPLTKNGRGLGPSQLAPLKGGAEGPSLMKIVYAYALQEVGTGGFKTVQNFLQEEEDAAFAALSSAEAEQPEKSWRLAFQRVAISG